MTMKLVVAGVVGAASSSTSRSALHSDSSASLEKRRQSSWCVGFGTAPVARGGMISSQS